MELTKCQITSLVVYGVGFLLGLALVSIYPILITLILVSGFGLFWTGKCIMGACDIKIGKKTSS